ncbi:MAG: hypothetical protein MJ252_15765 [archaeon]|nr:hypothetical protein [archaeon]
MNTQNYFTYLRPNTSYTPSTNLRFLRTVKYNPYTYPYMTSTMTNSNNRIYYQSSEIKPPLELYSLGESKTKLNEDQNIRRCTLNQFYTKNNRVFLHKLSNDDIIERTKYNTIKLLELIEKYKIAYAQVVYERDQYMEYKEAYEQLVEKYQYLLALYKELSQRKFDLAIQNTKQLFYAGIPKPEQPPQIIYVPQEPQKEIVYIEKEPKIVYVKEPVEPKPAPVPVYVPPKKEESEEEKKKRYKKSTEVNVEVNTDDHKIGALDVIRMKKIQKQLDQKDISAKKVKFSRGQTKYLDNQNKNNLEYSSQNNYEENPIQYEKETHNSNQIVYDQPEEPKSKIVSKTVTEKVTEKVTTIRKKNYHIEINKSLPELNSERVSIEMKQKVLKTVTKYIEELSKDDPEENYYNSETYDTKNYKEELKTVFHEISKNPKYCENCHYEILCMLVCEIMNSNPEPNFNYTKLKETDTSSYRYDEFADDFSEDYKGLLDIELKHFLKMTNPDEPIITNEVAAEFISKSVYNFKSEDDITDRLKDLFLEYLGSN